LANRLPVERTLLTWVCRCGPGRIDGIDDATTVLQLGSCAGTQINLPGSDPRGTVQEVYADASGRPLVETYRVEGMTHGAPVDPGSGATECGATGAYFLDGICSSYYTARFWGLEG
jgi:hypothetical protein